uniref:Cytochrome c oxidase subunit 7B, mitochondrial n=1 Tax=Sarcophilus harrisii TaxID=9305 RepID=A0A7N4NJI0_SARHA
LFPAALVRSALSRLPVRRGPRAAASRHLHAKKSDFDGKYGLPVFVGGSLFCIGTWVYTLKQYDLEHYVSPVGRVRPKSWKKE